MGLLQGGARRAPVGEEAEPDRAGAAQEGVRGAARRAAGARDGGRARAARRCLASAPIRAGNGSRPRDRLPRPMGLRRLLLALACAATAASLSGCFLEEEKEEGEAAARGPRRQGRRDRVHGLHHARAQPVGCRTTAGYWQGKEAPPGFALYGVFLQACNRSDEDDDLEDDTYEATDDFLVVDTQGNEYEPLEVEEENVFQYHAGRARAGRVHPRVRQPRPAGPDRRRDAAVPVPARGGREPPARARDPRRAAKRASSSSTSSRRAQPGARRAPPAPPSRRRRRCARAAPPRRSRGSSPARRR